MQNMPTALENNRNFMQKKHEIGHNDNKLL